MILIKDYVRLIRDGKAQVEVEKTEEHNEMLNLIFPKREKWNFTINDMSTFFEGNYKHPSRYRSKDEKFHNLPIIHASDIILDNTVIKVESEEHGKRVIEWWKEQGVDTIMSGTSIGSYYGIGKEGTFRVIFDDEMHNKKTITLPETFPSKQETKQENKMRTITWQEAQELIDMVDGYCGWKNMLLDLYARDIVLKKNIEVTSALLQQGRKEASQSQKEVIDKIFGKEKDEKEIDLNYESGIKGLKLFEKHGNTETSLIAVRTTKSFWLNPEFNWKLEKDKFDALCLIPTHK